MSLESWRKHLASLPNCNFTVTENPLVATFNHPGLNLNSFDRNHNIGILSLMALVMDVRIFGTSLKGNEMFNLEETLQDRLSFLTSTEFTISRTMYDRTIPKWPLQAKLHLGYMGNSSVAFSTELYVPGASEPLLTQCSQYVMVDPATRRSRPFPDWIREKYRHQCSMDKELRVNTFTRPETTFSYKRKVMWSDTDMYAHTNYASYVRYAVDGLHAAIKDQNAMEEIASSSLVKDSTQANIQHLSDGVVPFIQSNRQPIGTAKALKGISEIVIGAGVKNLKICYLSECQDGDTLDVHIWQDKGEEFIVRCSVEKNSAIICQIILEYFSLFSKL